MATVSTLVLPESGLGKSQGQPYQVSVEIDMAAAAVAKGSALASSDVIEAITLPEGTIVLAAGLECTETPAGGTGTVLDLGINGVDADVFVDGFAYDSATAGDYAAMTAVTGLAPTAADETIDILIQAASTVSTSGKVRAFAVLMPVGVTAASVEANEVQRDQLA